MTVWTFRYSADLKEKLGEFEYAGLSAFIGIIILALYNLTPKQNPDEVAKLFSNPFSTAITFSIFGMIFAWIAGLVYNKFIK
jgi:hypothetical protein